MNTLHPYIGKSVLSRDGDRHGVMVSPTRHACACGRIGKLRTVWDGGAVTYLCPRGLDEVGEGYRLA